MSPIDYERCQTERILAVNLVYSLVEVGSSKQDFKVTIGE